jgi:hypothetical protein
MGSDPNSWLSMAGYDSQNGDSAQPVYVADSVARAVHLREYSIGAASMGY